MQLLEGLDQIATDRTANTPGRQQHGVVTRGLDESIVDTDFAEFVDDDRRAGHRRVFQQAFQQCRLARAEKTGQDGHWNSRTGHEGGSPSAPRWA